MLEFNRKRKVLLLAGVMVWCLIGNGAAETNTNPTLDVYRSKQLTIASLQKDYGEDIKKLSDLLHAKDAFKSDAKMQAINRLQNKITSSIQKEGDFSLFI